MTCCCRSARSARAATRAATTSRSISSRAAGGTPAERPSAREVFGEFLRLGLVGFGGPSAHLALFRQRFVRELEWLTEAEFIDLLAAANLLPGPTSTEVALAIGQRRAGTRGLLLAGLA